MSRAPERCLYCDGTNADCGFCEMGKPLDTQEDWDKSWGRVSEQGTWCEICLVGWRLGSEVRCQNRWVHKPEWRAAVRVDEQGERYVR